MDKLISFLIATFFVAILAIISSNQVDTTSKWYICAKPDSMPEGNVFGVVWTILYIIFIYIFYKLLSRDVLDYSLLGLLGMVNILCVMWVYVFFQLHSSMLGMGVIVSILILSVYVTYLFYDGDVLPFPVWIMFPFLVWIMFATYLNFKTVQKDKKNYC